MGEEKDLYFKCNICNNIFYKKNKKKVNNDIIQNKFKNSYYLDNGYCEECYNYIKWENMNYK